MRNWYKISEKLEGCDYISDIDIGGNTMLKSFSHRLMGRVYMVQVSQDRV